MQTLDPATVITQIANQFGVPPNLALAIAQNESGLNPNAVGDNGTSFGLYQLHIGGELGNRQPAAVMGQNMIVNATIAISTIAAIMRANPGATPGAIAVLAQRPKGYIPGMTAQQANGTQYAATINAMLGAKGDFLGNVGMNGVQYGTASQNPNPILAQMSNPLAGNTGAATSLSSTVNDALNPTSQGALATSTMQAGGPLATSAAQEGLGTPSITNVQQQAQSAIGTIKSVFGSLGIGSLTNQTPATPTPTTQPLGGGNGSPA